MYLGQIDYLEVFLSGCLLLFRRAVVEVIEW